MILRPPQLCSYVPNLEVVLLRADAAKAGRLRRQCVHVRSGNSYNTTEECGRGITLREVGRDEG